MKQDSGKLAVTAVTARVTVFNITEKKNNLRGEYL
jgi:hypothetical protein